MVVGFVGMTAESTDQDRESRFSFGISKEVL